MPDTIGFLHFGFLISAILFIVGIKLQTKVKSARRGNFVAIAGMVTAILTTLLVQDRVSNLPLILGGLFVGSFVGVLLAKKLKMTLMPEYIAFCNGIGAAGSALIALGFILTQETNTFDLVMSVIGIFIGAFTFSGSVIAILKLSGKLASGKPIMFKGMRLLTVVLIGMSAYFAYELVIMGADILNNTETALMWISALMASGAGAGILMVLGIGGADMPVVVSLLNSYSGLSGAATGFAMGNVVVVVTGALIGASGLILTAIMCKAMNRSLVNVLFGGFGAVDTSSSGGAADEYTNVKSTSAEEVAMILDGVESVIIIPGYGMAVGQAQHAVKDLADELEKRGVDVKFAIHPVAGRMPGHMNVLLAEANVDYDKLKPLEEINGDFKNTDLVYVIGANDVVNPAAVEDPSSPIYGMPILNAHEAKTVVNVKRSLSPGFAAIKNGLFERDNSLMLFDDAKKATEEIVKELREM